ncbi:DUF3900 domain-containing protein [Bacillus haikouensis]|jgi:hypothetical protein|uniref:DUF3900 domain-containing protein n=1 Tax=Bacillus haikouensis TaxID=1510468 RepID=UPI0015526FB3|nr:DUF3900 domain-containing protein [Bacillus haikouensis]NQD68300.1 DUF3900 domain-containing protein [Bacillus haikouensis]
MDFTIQHLSFYLIQVDGKGEEADKHFKHFQTLTQSQYEESPLKTFLDGELTKIVKRKVDRHAKSDTVPTKIGRFIVEPGHELTSNPNYNLFHKTRFAENNEMFREACDQIVQMYIETSAIRGGALLVASAKLTKFFDDPFVFIMKCDFEPKVARITDESTLIHNVEMAITTKNMKSIQYPYMPEEGMMDSAELKIHQASHARYFEDFLKWVEYEKSMPEIVKSQVYGMVKEHIEESYVEESDERVEFEQAMEEWAISPKRELQERFSTEQVVEAASQIIEQSPEVELKVKLDHVSVKAMLSDFGDSIHLAKVNGKYILMIESESVLFEKGFSPLEFLKPDDLHDVIQRIETKE